MIAERSFLTSLSYMEGPADSRESLLELHRLAETAGMAVVGSHAFTRPHPDAALFLGPGQAQELKKLAADHQATLLVVDHELKPMQQRNLERAIGLAVMDRTQLILDIFARRAKSHEGKIQVELAQLTYLLPRLIGKGLEMSRLGGGGIATRGATRGPGETKLEYDRRRVRDRIAVLRRQLEALRRTRQLHRQDRGTVPLPLVSLVGYTNAGKSALLRALTGSQAFVEDKLFATLDLSTRRLVLPPSQEALLTDTVGFIRRLPHHLVAAFRGTLEEVKFADLLLHVVDGSHPDWEAQARTVDQVLEELEAGAKPNILVFNKRDKFSAGLQRRLRYQFPEALQVSALTGEGLDELRRAVAARLASDWQAVTLRLPYHRAEARAQLLKRGRVLSETYGPKVITLRIELPPKFLQKVRQWQREWRQESPESA
ncbi:MAG: GTPase HflX [candidate division FCPU426 bacterium]